MDDDLLFARSNRVGEALAELRCNLPLVVLGVIDSVATSESRMTGKFVSRTDIVSRILNEFVNHKIDEASLISNAVKHNPTVVD
jgi:hypothetical protein